MILTVTAAALRAGAEEEGPHFASRNAGRLLHVERLAWSEKKPGKNAAVPLRKLYDPMLRADSIEFALWALGWCAEEAEANRVGSLISLDLAEMVLRRLTDRAGLGFSPQELSRHAGSLFETLVSRKPIDEFMPWLKTEGGMADGLLGKTDLDWADEVEGTLLRMVAGPFGQCPDSEYPARAELSRYAAAQAYEDFRYLLAATDGHYLAARRVADLAYAAEARWQRGTRLDFEFTGDIRELMERLEGDLTRAMRDEAADVAAEIFLRLVKG